MEDMKIWYQLCIIWGVVIVIFVLLVYVGGYNFLVVDQGQFVDVVFLFVGMVGGFVVIWGCMKVIVKVV